MKRAAAVSCVALFALFVSGVASAGLFRTYLSASGNDANPCTLQQPCRLLPAALAAVNISGEVWMLDSANYNTNTVSVTKSVTILAIPGALGSLVAPLSADGLQINVSPDVGAVTLRNLIVRDLSGPGTSAGIRLVTAANLRIENCEIYGVSNAIALDGNGSLSTIVNTSIHDVLRGVEANAGTHVSIDGLSVSNTLSAVRAMEGARATISNSMLSDSVQGIVALSASIPGTVVYVARSTISSTGVGGTGFVAAAGAGLITEIFVHSSTIHADVGFSITGSAAQIFTYGDNRLVYYTAKTQGGSLTSISGI